MAKDFYAVLSLPRNASEDQVRLRFRELARERHPDRFQGDAKARAEHEFQEITQAFNVLGDAERRRLHDLELQRRPEASSGPADLRQLCRAYLQRGIKAYREKNFPVAIENFDLATQADRSSGQAWQHLALACSQTRSLSSRAVAAIEHACRLEPMNPAYLKLAGRLLLEAGDSENAERYYREALTWGDPDREVEAALEALRRAPRRGLFGRMS
ncbi:MAG TPA: DnaJ domain-containing protein [Thermoanaerobaculia bacterium]|nr:DnaJ domain-containing protein [Thermoanaerobaculia bacterium]